MTINQKKKIDSGASANVTAVKACKNIKAVPPTSVDIRLEIHSAEKNASKQFMLPELCFLNIR